MTATPAEQLNLWVVVVTYNSPGLLETCLIPSGIEAAPARVVVVDNSDEGQSVEAIARICLNRGWDCIGGSGNTGFGAGVNAGAAHAIARGASALIILNPDAWMDAATARELGRRCKREPDTATSPILRRPDGRIWFSRGCLNMRRGRVRSSAPELGPDATPWLTGAALAMSSSLWDRVGGFDQRYFLYWEDVELSWRILAAGGGIRVCEDLTAFHLVGATQAGSHKSPAFVYYNSRNRLLFAADHVEPSQQVGWLLETPRLTWELVGLGGRTPAAAWAGIRGVTAGLRALARATRLRRRRRPMVGSSEHEG